MDKKTKGSWLIHHTNKLQGVTNQIGYEKTFLAGKAGILLSAISSNNQVTVNNDRLTVLAKAANICRIPDDHKDAYETGLAENRTSPS